MSREQDKLVAEKVMGWIQHNCNDGFIWCYKLEDDMPGACAAGTWYPTTNPSDDYQVLKHIRENWDYEQVETFYLKLELEWAARGTGPGMGSFFLYEPGDYSISALEVLGEI